MSTLLSRITITGILGFLLAAAPTAFGEAAATTTKAVSATAPTRNLQNNNNNNNNVAIKLAGILDTTNFDWAENLFRITVGLLNQRGNGFFDAELADLEGTIEYEVLDGECDGFAALSRYYEVKKSGSVQGVVGARCSGASIPLAWIGALDNLPQVSMSSTSAKLSDKRQFPNFSRTVPPDDERGQVGALVATLDLFGWNRVTILVTDTPFAKDLATSFRALWKGETSYQATIKLDPESDGVDADSLEQVLEGVPLDNPEINSKVVMIMARDDHAYAILEEAHRVFPPETFFVGPEAWAGRDPPDSGFPSKSPVSWDPPDSHQQSSYLPQFPGYLGVVPYTERFGSPVYRWFVELGYKYYSSLMPRILDDNNQLPDYAADHAIDAIIALCLALASLPPGERGNGVRVTEKLRALDFVGASGRVQFTPEGDRADPQFSIVNYRPQSIVNYRPGRAIFEWVEVGITGVEPGSARFADGGIQQVCFAGLGCNLDAPPDGNPVVPPEPVAVWAPVVIGLLCVVFGGGFYCYRRKKILASRKTRAILRAKESELDDFRNSVVDMCTAEERYVPATASSSSFSNGSPGNGAGATGRVGLWCWMETKCQMDQWKKASTASMIWGDPADCWIRYDHSANRVLELAYQEQGHIGSFAPRTGYTVDFRTMIQTKDQTGYQRKVKRVEIDLSSFSNGSLGNGAGATGRVGVWCWMESKSQMDQRKKASTASMIWENPADCWIRYNPSANRILELAYQEQGHIGICVPRPGYTLDFRTMIQTQDQTGYRRQVKRVEIDLGAAGAANGTVAMTNGYPLEVQQSQPQPQRSMPREILGEPQMVLVPGDIVQVSKKRDDGWAYGSKLHLEDEPLALRLVQKALASRDRSSISSTASISSSGAFGNLEGAFIITDKNGWFPLDATRVPNTDDLGILRKTLGAADDLAPPPNWDAIVDPSVVQKSLPLDAQSSEYKAVAAAFMSTISSGFEIVRIQRIQNVAMWQSYIVKRKTVVDRDVSLQAGGSLGVVSGTKQALARFERRWLWHGTNEDSVEKIIQQGFNRSFCGKNATMYGKGVYFARDASYSSSKTYSPPNAAGHKHVLACSVVVGEFCRGRNDARTPDLRDATKNVLFDSTVDDILNPSLYVTYHDAQAYPEYLILFKEKRKSFVTY